MKLGITGDTHGDLYFKQIYKAKKEGYTHLIICGDFGYIWSGSAKENKQLDYLNKIGITILFIDGNHENFPLLNTYYIEDMYGGRVHKIRDNIFHLMRGEYYTINNTTFWCMGGAKSTDLVYTSPTGKQKERIENKDWWREEIPSISERDYGVENLRNHGNVVDYIITHTSFPQALVDVGGQYRVDTLSDYFSYIYETVTYKQWFFGHMHTDKSSDILKTRCIYKDIIDIPEV